MPPNAHVSNEGRGSCGAACHTFGSSTNKRFAWNCSMRYSRTENTRKRTPSAKNTVAVVKDSFVETESAASDESGSEFTAFAAMMIHTNVMQKSPAVLRMYAPSAGRLNVGRHLSRASSFTKNRDSKAKVAYLHRPRANTQRCVRQRRCHTHPAAQRTSQHGEATTGSKSKTEEHPGVAQP